LDTKISKGVGLWLDIGKKQRKKKLESNMHTQTALKSGAFRKKKSEADTKHRIGLSEARRAGGKVPSKKAKGNNRRRLAAKRRLKYRSRLQQSFLRSVGRRAEIAANASFVGILTRQDASRLGNFSHFVRCHRWT